jgi:hypothetical protein
MLSGETSGLDDHDWPPRGRARVLSQSWGSEHQGRARYDLARECLEAAPAVHDAFSQVAIAANSKRVGSNGSGGFTAISRRASDSSSCLSRASIPWRPSFHDVCDMHEALIPRAIREQGAWWRPHRTIEQSGPRFQGSRGRGTANRPATCTLQRQSFV